MIPASETVLCKICDVRDYRTAVRCAELGVTYLGLHCIKVMKPERGAEFIKIARALPLVRPGVGIVMVTRAIDIGHVAEMAHQLQPTHVQLHNRVWDPGKIETLRGQFVQLGLERVKIIGVAVPSQLKAWYDEVCRAVDMVIVDRTYHDEDEPTPVEPLPPEAYVEPILWVRSRGMPAFIAGGLTPQNVAEYVRAARPSGVDVQTGVEVLRKPGVKDERLVRQLLEAVKSA